MAASNAELQREELEALQAIYEDCCIVWEEERRLEVLIRVPEDLCRQAAECALPLSPLKLRVVMTEGYPSTSLPDYELDAAWTTPEVYQEACAGLTESAQSMGEGEVVVFAWVEFLKDEGNVIWNLARARLEEATTSLRRAQENSDLVTLRQQLLEDEDVAGELKDLDLRDALRGRKTTRKPADVLVEAPPITSDEPITERKSTFQAHVATVLTVEQVKAMVATLGQNSKIARATHNIMAYRIYLEDSKSYMQDYDDDGENAAGGRLLHLLQVLNCRNVCVVVSRWFGGVLLGPERFKLINNCARAALVGQGYVESEAKAPGKGRASTKSRK
mmetsp:Transcript_7728/g.28502  ORF Transcript_7728/g.28502 Transcript_7728/m.28502 type:complete len:332 (+) Transcript_7728:105-1100(+)